MTHLQPGRSDARAADGMRPPGRILRAVCAGLATAALAWLLSGCVGPGYYAQAVAGHLALMHDRVPIEEVLRDPATSPQEARRLAEAVRIRTFAIEHLALPDNGSYTQYVATGRSAVSWNVVAAPEFSLTPRTWCFLVAGCVPYRGYFDESRAERFARDMRDKGLDVAVMPVAAYSTLGWFADPLLDTMLRYDVVHLAAVMFHEMAHEKLYLKGDAEFSESYASFVETTGVNLWLAATGDPTRESEWRADRQAEARFDQLLGRTRDALAELYGSTLPAAEMRTRKADILAAAAEDYRAIVRNEWRGRDPYAAWFEGGLNNARLALHESYRGGTCAFAALYREAGEDMARFHALAKARAAEPDDVRQAWLQQPCAAVASRNDL